jgi:hypothetical protein
MTSIDEGIPIRASDVHPRKPEIHVSRVCLEKATSLDANRLIQNAIPHSDPKTNEIDKDHRQNREFHNCKRDFSLFFLPPSQMAQFFLRPSKLHFHFQFQFEFRSAGPSFADQKANIKDPQHQRQTRNNDRICQIISDRPTFKQKSPDQPSSREKRRKSKNPNSHAIE